MKRQEIIDGATQITQAIESSKIFNVLTHILRLPTAAREAQDYSGDLLTALRAYSIQAHNFSRAARTISRIFELDLLEQPRIWGEMLQKGRTPRVSEARYNLNFAIGYLPKIIELIEQTPLAEIKKSELIGEHRFEGMRVLSVNVFEDKNALSSPTRLANVLEGINHFYTACALLQGESPSGLSVIACDSGSDKSFDFLGLAKVIECVVHLIETLWDRTVFFRERQFNERLDLITKSLPIIEKINTMEEQKQIDRELAEILRRNVFDGANMFIQSGATIPEIEDKAHVNPRALLAPSQKLLVAAPAQTEEPADTQNRKQEDMKIGDFVEEDSIESMLSNLSEDEQKLLKQLLGKAKIDAVEDSENKTNPKSNNMGDDINSTMTFETNAEIDEN